MYDLNLKYKPSIKDKDKRLILRRAIELGWTTIAWNLCITG